MLRFNYDDECTFMHYTAIFLLNCVTYMYNMYIITSNNEYDIFEVGTWVIFKEFTF